MTYSKEFQEHVYALYQQVEHLSQEVKKTNPSDDQTYARLAVVHGLLHEIQNFVAEGIPYQEVTKEGIERVLSSLLVDLRYIRVFEGKQGNTYRVVVNTTRKEEYYVGSYADVNVAIRERNLFVLANPDKVSETLVRWVQTYYQTHVLEYEKREATSQQDQLCIPEKGGAKTQRKEEQH